MNPTRQIITASAGSGKTNYTIERILQQKSIRTWGKIWVLLPTNLQVATFRDRLLERYQMEDISVYFGVQFFNFYELYDHLLNTLHVPQKQVNRASVYRIIRHLIDQPDVVDNLQYLAPIVHKPGLIDLVVSFIYELKEARCTPDKFSAYADHLPSDDFRTKTQDMALIYSAYQEFLLKNDLVDREGAGWLALATLEKETVKLDGVSMLIVDGFTQFSPLQARLLHEVTSYIPQTILTLTHEDRRATTIHRSFERTLQRLQTFGEWEIQPLKIQNTWQKPPLTYLQEHFMAMHADPISAADTLHLLEAPNPETEVQMVLRDVKQKLLAGVHPEEMVILVRNQDPYLNLLRRTATRYHIPLALREGISLNHNPAIATLLDLLHLSDRTTNFRRQAVMDILRNPYLQIPFAGTDIDALERISLRYRIINRRDKWIQSIEYAIQRQAEDAEQQLEERVEDDAELVSTPAIDETLADRLDDFLARITPPRAGTPTEFLAWLEDLLGYDPRYITTHNRRHPDEPLPEAIDSLNVYVRLQQDVKLGDNEEVYAASQAVITRDLHAFKQFRQTLRAMLTAYHLLEDAQDEPLRLTWQDFLADLERTLRYAQTEQMGATYRSGHVLATTVFEARGLPHNYVYMLGMAEGQFPAQRNEDPLYSDRERQRLNQGEIQVTLTTEEEDDTSVFYTCAAMAQQQLILSRPTIDEKANPWQASVLWQATLTLLDNPTSERILAGQPLELTTAADEFELAVSVAHALNHEIHQLSQARIVELDHLVQWLRTEARLIWENVETVRHIENQRRAVFDEYSGLVSQPVLQEVVKQQLNLHRVWSASQFNDYGYCPFRFYAKRVLKLQKFEEPTEGLDALQLGSLQHQILEYAYRHFQHADYAISPENLTLALDILETRAKDLFERAPFEFQFRASGVWEQEKAEILQRLLAFVSYDFEVGPVKGALYEKLGLTPDEPRYVHAVEMPFGFEDIAPAELHGTSGILLVGGLIDRVDRIGNTLVIMDYKSGVSLPDEKQIEQARHFQMMIYLRAAQQLIARDTPDLNVHAGLFWSLRRPERTVLVKVNDARLTELEAVLHENIERGRAGDFRVQPNGMEDGKCFKYCEYHQLCRVVRSDMYKI